MNVSPSRFKTAFDSAVTDTPTGMSLREAALGGKLGTWTGHLTAACVDACRDLGLRASAKGHKHDLLPVARSEYLSLDVVAFREERKHWLFPSLVAELENQTAFDFIAYSLWKVLCVTANLRLVFCYRKNPDEGPALIKRLRQEVAAGLGIDGRLQLVGETVVVIGSRNDAETFPYGFFNWWVLDCATGQFSRMT